MNINTEELLWILFIGLIAGYVAGVLVRGGGFGIIVNIVVGIIGAFLGTWIFSAMGITIGSGIFGALIVATLGAVVFVAVLSLFRRPGRR
jgi:uncharacterized membrane protein YeaQ/YmgE (transglycosylase-associated protein family)